ncbi:MAG TPA: PHP-associated domain-containing protein [Candidatus Limnocylindria bacterium]|jgi:predicted metal-dependent phosphoesterase TrpH
MTVQTFSEGRRRGTGPRAGGERGRADMHVHSLYSDGTASVGQILEHVEQHTDLDVIAITDHERIDGAQRAAELHAAGDFSFDLVVGEEITTRRGHVLALFIHERIPALLSLDESLRRIHAQGGIAIAAHPMAPLPLSVGRRSLRSVRDATDEGIYFDALELFNPSHAGRMRHEARLALNAAELGLPGVGNSDGHVLEGIGTGATSFPGHTAVDYRAAVAAGTVMPEGEHWSAAHNVDVYRRQLRAKLRHLWHTVKPGSEDWR